jgi:hypothetical protein
MQNSEKFGKEQSCSNQTQGSAELVKKQVTKRSILSRSKLPVGVSELHTLVLAAKVSYNPLDA